MTETEGPYGPLIETRLRVLTWNLWHRFGPWEARRPAIARRLRVALRDALREIGEAPGD